MLRLRKLLKAKTRGNPRDQGHTEKANCKSERGWEVVEGNVGLGQTEIRSEQETEMMAQKDAKRSRGRQRQIDRVWEKCISPQSLQFCNKQPNLRHILTYALKSDFFRLRKTKSRTRPHRKSQNQEYSLMCFT